MAEEMHPLSFQRLGQRNAGSVDRVVQVNAPYQRASAPSRAGLCVRYLANRLSTEQPDVLWEEYRDAGSGPVFLRAGPVLAPGERLVIVDDRLYDFFVGVPFVKVRREATRVEGYLTFETLVGETACEDNSLWLAADRPLLKSRTRVDLGELVLYSTIQLRREKLDEAQTHFEGYSAPHFDPTTDNGIHPLYVGSEAHRLALWAADARCLPDEKRMILGRLAIVFESYVIPCAHRISHGAVAWPYRFDFTMPWGTRLTAPWFSGYANSAIAGAAALMYLHTNDERYARAAHDAIGFLRLPMSEGGALYHTDGHWFIAEYAYRSPPVPNYRVLDGELLSLPYLYNAAVILRDSTLLQFVMDLGAGLARSIALLVRRDKLPAFGMDGQAMNPNYMWQLWAGMQTLSAILKDRTFADAARNWRKGIPPDHRGDAFPL